MQVNNAGAAGIGIEGDPLVITELVEGDIASVFSDGEVIGCRMIQSLCV